MSTTHKPDPNAGALFLAKLLAEDEADRIESMSDEEFLAEQRRTGRDRVRVPTTEELLTRVKAKAEARQAAATRTAAHTNGHRTANGHGVAHRDYGVAPVERLPPLSRGQRLALLLAAAFVVAIVVAVVEGPDIVASVRSKRGENREPGPTPRAMAEKLRDDAIGRCEQGAWAACKDKLDEATRLDPAGDTEPRVQAARTDIAKAAQPVPAPKPDKATP